MRQFLEVAEISCQTEPLPKDLPLNSPAGLRERVTALGGRLEADLLPWSNKGRFRLWVELPLQSRAQTEGTQREQP